MIKSNSKKAFLIVTVLVALLAFVGIGYAYLSQKLNVEGTGTLNTNLSVAIDETATETGLEGCYSVTNEGKTITFTIQKLELGTTYTCTFTVTNTGELDAEYKQITPGADNTVPEDGLGVSYSLVKSDVGASTITKDASHTFVFTFAFEELADVDQGAIEDEYTFSYTIEYVQA